MSMSASEMGISYRQISYFFKEGRSFWTITFSAAAEEFDRLAAVFEHSARTFAVAPDLPQSSAAPEARR